MLLEPVVGDFYESAVSPRVLIVDDRVTNRNILARLARLLHEDTIVESFGDPLKALKAMRETTPDLIITDFKMPDLDGAEFTHRVRQLPGCYDVPIIVITVYEDREFRYRALEAGATDFLLSPFDHHEFRVRARNLLTLRRQQQIIKNRCYSLERTLEVTTHAHEEALRASEEMLRHIINSVPAMISVSDPEGRFVMANQATCKFFGTTLQRTAGRRMLDVMGAEHGMQHIDHRRERALKGQ